MSELNFPKNPAVGQEYTFNSLLYMFDGVKWVTKGTGYNPVQDLYEMLASDAGASFVGANGYDNVQAALEDLRANASSLEAVDTDLQAQIDTKINADFVSRFDRESLRRSYADAGYNLVAGSFEAGGTLVNVNDVLLHEASGKAFTGPAGTVAAGTNPASGGFVDVSSYIGAAFNSVADVAAGKFAIGDVAVLSDRDFTPFVVVSGGTPNGFNVIDAGNSNTAILDVSSGVITAKAFGLKADGSDETGGLHALRDYMNANSHIELVLNHGTYTYSVSPNWSIQNLSVRTSGKVNFNCIGTGNCLIFSNPTGTTFNVNWCWGGDFYILGESTTLDGVFIESTHHSKIKANIRGCGRYAQNVEFSICNEYDIVASINQGEWYNNARPTRGINVTRRGTGQNYSSANTWTNPIIEGVNGVGMLFDYALMNHINGGTSEGNAGSNVVCTVNSRDNKFNGIDLEVPGNGIGLSDAGRRNTFTELLNDSETIIESTAVGSTLRGGIYDGITNAGRASTLEDFSYGAKGGEVVDSGTETTVREVFDLESSSFKVDNKIRGKAILKRQITTGAWASPSAVPASVSKTVAVAGVVAGDIISANPVSQPADNYVIAYSAPSDGNIKIVITQTYGVAASPYPGGVVFNAVINRA